MPTTLECAPACRIQRPDTGPSVSAGVDRDPGPTGSAEFPLRNFGTWVDDTSVLGAGEAWVGFGAAYWRLSYADQVEAPLLDASVGIAPHVQVAATIPFSRLHYPDGFTDRYVGDTYLSVKIGVREAGTGAGVAVAPLVEVLSDGSALGADGQPIGRVHWGIPVNIEYRATGWRVYGSAGYFSRGAVFGSGSFDLSLGTRAGVLGIIGYTYSTAEPIVFDTGTTTNRSRVDASGGAYARVSPGVSVYGLIGRTISNQDAYATSFLLSAGVTLRVHPPPPPAHRSDLR